MVSHQGGPHSAEQACKAAGALVAAQSSYGGFSTSRRSGEEGRGTVEAAMCQPLSSST